MEKKVKIAIVDDHEFFRKGVILTLSRLDGFEVIAEASDGKEIIEILKHARIDIILMDIKMKEMDGIEATKIICEKYPDTKVIALSMFGEEEYLESMLKSGISGFLLKTIDKDGLERALRMITEGKNYFSEELIPYFTNKYMNKPLKKEISTALTTRELEILKLISEGLSNQQISEKLFISLRTVTNHRANINMKTGSKNTATLLAYAIKHKLIDI